MNRSYWSHRLRVFPVSIMAVLALLLTSLAPGSASAATDEDLAPLLAADGEVVPGAYIVVMDPDADGGEAADASEALAASVESSGGQVTHRYSEVLVGFAATMDAETVERLRAAPLVSYIEPDGVVTTTADQNNPTWGLDRVDERDLPMDNKYHYDNDGSGATVYVIDTGIRSTHSQLAGRVAGTRSFIGGNGEDCDGHGTHVAGTVAATTYGVAKQADVYGIRVLDCNGSGTWSGVIAGMDWVAANHSSPAVANMSLGGGANTSVDVAVRRLYNAGVLPVVSAGNDDLNACVKSPARASEAITIGSTTSTDQRSWFSNYGSCVDMFAPGSFITSLWHTSNSATNTISGTSMASPHVAGIAALYLGSNPTASPGEVTSAILNAASVNKVSDTVGSPNLLAYSLVPDPLPATVINADIEEIEGDRGTKRIRVWFELDRPAIPIDGSGFASMRVTTVDGSATRADGDFRYLTRRVQWGPGVTSRFVDFRIVGDTDYENDETFEIQMSEPNKVELGDGTIVVTIKNDDEMVVTPTVSVASTTVTETDRNQVLRLDVQLDEPSTKVTRVRYTTVEGSASKTSDYVNRSGLITFPAGQTAKTAIVTIRGDLVNEPTEFFEVRLSDPTGLELGDDAVVTIIDNDPVPPTVNAISQTVYETERNQVMKLTFELDRAVNGVTRVRYATVPGSATRNQDYVHRAGVVTFARNQTSKTVNITIKGDGTSEFTEQFTVVMSNPTGLDLGTNAAVTIIDND